MPVCGAAVHMPPGPRPGKKLLVCDIDYTLYDHRSGEYPGLRWRMRHRATAPHCHCSGVHHYANVQLCHGTNTPLRHGVVIVVGGGGGQLTGALFAASLGVRLP